MHVRCPHCHNPIELVAEASLQDIVCPSCGSSFNLVGTETTESYRPGTQMLGHFEVIQQLGVGRFGSVWKARDTELDRIVAVKLPRQERLNSDEMEVSPSELSGVLDNAKSDRHLSSALRILEKLGAVERGYRR